jgi:phospholipid-binding lipoprotein MlaA
MLSSVIDRSVPSRPAAALALVLASLALLGGCATSGPPGAEFNDPYETVNRQVHAFNKGVDTIIYRPVSMAYGYVLPKPIRQSVNNASRNFGEPQAAVNNLFQGDVESAFVSVFRFGINSTFGIAGLFDLATPIGLEERDTDFGETLHVWGVGEGAYLAVPMLGPSTQRDTVGDVVDFFTDPFAPFLTYPEALAPTATWLLENADYRYQFRNSIDGVLYESADSYAQSRLIYLENRRFELGSGAGDIYVDPYLTGVIDPYDTDAAAPAGASPAPSGGTGIIDPYEDF